MRETGECERETEIETEGNSSRACWIELELGLPMSMRRHTVYTIRERENLGS